ncbi:arylsulfate sulfotransferase [Kiloniella spongiae]|uniref:Arylsulfate sulfotransferase n=1 Tax=Kiloniella spongiae TaxID=1489064 RepID=A0A0H2MZI7_9PROT|nr:ribbon-helix-helix domain-containing protein [Kiloniella spongiae]KLN62070.1 arylsulfate sulfotransferase [Kiloniella spongiae]
MVLDFKSEEIKKRSVTISGHRTSFSLEEGFWQEIKILAKREGLSLNQFVEKVDEARTSNLSSALRILVLNHLKEQLENCNDDTVLETKSET